MYEITGDIDELREMTKGIAAAEPALNRAVVSALNKTAITVRAKAVSLIASDYNIPHKVVRKELVIFKARYVEGISGSHWGGGPVAKIAGSGSPGIPLYKFSPTPKRVPSTRRTKSGKYTPRGGIKVVVTRGQRKMVKGSFIARMASGHEGIFRRAKNERVSLRTRRTVIEEMYGPSPLRLIEQDRYQIPMDEVAGEALDKNMASEANHFLKRYKVIPDA